MRNRHIIFVNCFSNVRSLANSSEEEAVELKGTIKKLQTELRDRRVQISSLEREINDMDKDISTLEEEKLKAQARCRKLENDLRVANAQVDELLSTNLDNENVIRLKV